MDLFITKSKSEIRLRSQAKLFTDVTVFRFFLSEKSKPQRSIYHAQFSYYAKFYKNPSARQNMGPQSRSAKFYQEIYSGAPWQTLLCKNWQLCMLATGSYETLHVH